MENLKGTKKILCKQKSTKVTEKFSGQKEGLQMLLKKFWIKQSLQKTQEKFSELKKIKKFL